MARGPYGGGGPLPAGVDADVVVLAQTHVVAPNGTKWTTSQGLTELRMVASRDALALVKLPSVATTGAQLLVYSGASPSIPVTSLPLNSPATIPPSQDGAVPVATDRHWVTIPATFVQPNMSVRAVASDGTTFLTRQVPINVGMDSDLTLYLLPFYLYGANETNTRVFRTNVTVMPSAIQNELWAKWPVARLRVINHAAGVIQWPYIVTPPRGGNPARILRDRADETVNGVRDGFTTMGAIMGLLSAINSANGESNTNLNAYAAMLTLEKGVFSSAGGGLGGGARATGDHYFSGILFHEEGHGFGMPHAADGYNSGSYAYVGGSLLGSAWGYDSVRQVFIPAFITNTSSNFATCQKDPARFKDASGRCVKQDPMQGGAGDQARTDAFAMHGDYNAAVVQRSMESRVHVDASSPTGYSKWDPIAKRRVPVPVATTGNAVYGLDSGLALVRNVPVTTIIFTFSQTTPSVNQIYPALTYTGNLMRVLDPTNATQMATITSKNGENVWFCSGEGCDYTLRVTMSDASVRHILVQAGFRKWFSDDANPDANDATNGASFQQYAVNIDCRGGKSVVLAELLSTPKAAVNGVPQSPTVVASRAFP